MANDEMKQIWKVPEPTLRRLPWYLAFLKLMKGRGETFVSSTQIAKEINVDPSQVAKDLSFVNISGKTRVGYEIGTLVDVLEDFLGFTAQHKAFLFGVGSLGAALLQDSGLKQYGLEIVGGFDVRRELAGTEINGMGPKISNDKVQELMEKLDTLKEGDVLFLAGSIPSSMLDDMYEKIMARLDGKGVMIVVDATRDLLVNVLKYHPFLVKPNNHELGEIFGVELKTRQDVIPYGKKLQEKGARNVLISMAGEGAVLVAEDGQVFEKPAPKGILVNGVGAGDSMVAGFMAGWMEKHNYEYAFHMGISAGSASAFSENLATKEEVQAVYKQVTEG